MRHPMWLRRLRTQPPQLVLLVFLEIALEPFDMGVALEGEHVGRHAVEEHAVVRDDHRAAGIGFERVLKRAQRLGVEVVGRFVEQQHVAAVLQHLGEVHAVALATGEIADLLLLVGAAEIEGGAICARIDLVLAELDHFGPTRNFLPDVLVGIERVAALVDITHLHRLADADRAGVGLLVAGEHAEQRRLASAVRADDADDAAGRQLEGEVFDQHLVGKTLGQAVDLDDDIAEALAGRNDDLRVGRLAVLSLLDQFLIRLDARLRLGLASLRRGRDPLALAPDRLLAGVVLAAFLDEALGLGVEILRVVALVGNAATPPPATRPSSSTPSSPPRSTAPRPSPTRPPPRRRPSPSSSPT